jgi:superfamily II DNA or RNA helicase
MGRNFSEKQRDALWIAAGGRCQNCGAILTPGWHADHVDPWSNGGPTDVLNGQALCETCNLKKGIKTVSQLPYNTSFTYAAPKDFRPREWQNEALDVFLSKVYGSARPQPVTFLVDAGVGSGKTSFFALAAANLLNSGRVRRVMYLCPNEIIRSSVIATFDKFNIKLIDWSNRRDRLGEPVGCQGAVTTYQSLAANPHIYRQPCAAPTLIVPDEIHHLGDGQPGDKQCWAQAARIAFEDVPDSVILSGTGTGYRSDSCPMPFTETVPGENGIRELKPDYQYTLGRAIYDGYCRKPLFRFHTASVQIPIPQGNIIRSFDDELPIEQANARLGGAVRRGTHSRRDFLRSALAECLDMDRRIIIFVGGDSGSDTLATEDAERYLPRELMSLGILETDIVSVTNKDKKSARKINEFAKSGSRVLCTVNMVSEGVDIPELSAAIFLTSITTRATTVQRIGRVLRRGEGNIATALIFMFSDLRYIDIATRIEESVKYEIATRGPSRHIDSPSCVDPGPRHRRHANGLESAPDGFAFNGGRWTEADFCRTREDLARRGLPQTTEYIAMALALGDAHD